MIRECLPATPRTITPAIETAQTPVIESHAEASVAALRESLRDAECPIDLDTLLERCLGDASFCRRILEKFSGRVNAQLGEIQQAVATHNAAELKLKAHALKGAAANLSADCLWACAAEIEQLAAADDWTRTLVVVGELAAEIARCRQHIPRLSEVLAAR